MDLTPGDCRMPTLALDAPTRSRAPQLARAGLVAKLALLFLASLVAAGAGFHAAREPHPGATCSEGR